jgi:uncharacterized Zn-binding protein involved in type VI secretion
MHITRKQALVALVAGAVPWIARRSYAQPAPVPQATTRVPAEAAPTTQTQLDELRKRIAALEAQLAQQVAFLKDDRGNLTLSAPGSVTLNAAANLTLVGQGAIALRAAGVLNIKGSQINLN